MLLYVVFLSFIGQKSIQHFMLGQDEFKKEYWISGKKRSG